MEYLCVHSAFPWFTKGKVYKLSRNGWIIDDEGESYRHPDTYKGDVEFQVVISSLENI